MARASTRTKLPLSVWAKLMGLHPLHFEQVRLNDENPHCSEIMFQHSWQTSDHVSREEIAIAIAEAESRIENTLGYRLVPTWEVDEWRGTIRPTNKDFVNYNSADVRGYHQVVTANWGYMISGGIQAKTLISAGADITYTDVDSDLYFETATVTVTTVAVDPNEIAIFYPGKDGDDTWEIRPIEVSISSGAATITFKRELAVTPDILDLYDIEGAEAIGTNDDDFLEEVDVYRRYNDPQTQASMLWEPMVTGWCDSCQGAGCSACAYSAQTGCLLVRGDPRKSILAYHPAEWDSDDNVFNSIAWARSQQPDIVRLYYYAGWRNKSQRYVSRMDPEWERTVAYMAAAMLDRPPCSCVKGSWDTWRQDYLLASGDGDGKAIFQPLAQRSSVSNPLDNPFGYRRGEFEAWRKVRSKIIASGIVV